MKYTVLVLSVYIVFFAGCSSSKDVYEYAPVEQSEDMKPMEESNFETVATAPSARHDEGDVGNVKQSEDVKPAEESNQPIAMLTIPVKLEGGITTEDQKAKEAVDRALKVLGGADKIDGIKSLIIKGTLTTTSLSSLSSSGTHEYEFRVLLPDNNIYIAKGPSISERYLGGIRYSGFSQGKIFTSLQHGTDRATMERALGASEFFEPFKNLSLLLLGTLMKSGPVLLTISSGSQPSVFDLTANTGQRRLDMPGQIEFDPETGYPSAIRVVDSYGGIAERQYRDRFPVNGIMFPRVITSNSSTGSSEDRIEEVQINPKLSLNDFVP